jgi:hypothetical protein
MASIDSDGPSKSSLTMDDARGLIAITESKHKPKSLLRTVVSQLFGLAWIGAIVALLIFNFSGWVLGASVSCGLNKNCEYDPFDPDAFKKAEQLDKKDHNILGALQFVAKALEVWFMVLAASLVYDVTMLLAAKDDGLPLGFLMTHMEFSDIMSLGERSFWASAKPSNHGKGWWSKKSFTLYAFVFFVTLLCIVANLMGPATAVLVIPTLGNNEIDFHNGKRFASSGASDPPINASIAAGCKVAALADGNYTCTNIYAGAVDAFSTSIIVSTNQSQLDSYLGRIVPAISQEDLVAFAFNFTDPNGGFWVPSRQVLRELSADYAPYAFTKVSDEVQNFTLSDINSVLSRFYNRSISAHLYDSYRNSLQATLHRQGPTINLNGFCYRGNETVISLSDDRTVRCFNGSNYWTDYPVKCIRQGSGWTANTPRPSTHFSIGDISSQDAPPLAVSVYATDRAIYLNTSFASCAIPPTSSGPPPCDWSALFAEEPFIEMKNMTQSQQIFSYSLPHSTATRTSSSSSSSTTTTNSSAWCDSIAYLNTTDYTLDPSPITNFLTLIGIDTVGNVSATDPIPIHPDWNLAAWSIARGGTVSPDRAASQNLISAFKSVVRSLAPANPNATDSVMDLLVLQHFFVTAQGLTLIPYDTTPVPTSPSASQKPTPAHPIFKVSLTLRVWAYGLGSRTSKLGLAVALTGIAIVLFRSFMGLFVRINRKRTLELFAAALEHEGISGGFSGLKSEREVNEVRFRSSTREGRVVFVPKGGGVGKVVAGERRGELMEVVEAKTR